MKKILICLLCLLLLCGCTSVNESKTPKLTIVATNFPLYDFARAIGGENIEIKMLIKAGCEVHSYDPLPSDMTAIYNSDLFLYIGGESDNWAQTLLDDAKVKSVSFMDCIKTHHDHDHDHDDEHIWTSSENAILMLQKICQSIIEIDKSNADVYRKNCDEYIKKIETASKEIEKTVKNNSEKLILVADRFPYLYFAEQYGIKYEAAFDGCAVSTDISLKTMMNLTEIIKKNNIKTVFCTELSSQNVAKCLKEELGVEIVELHSAHNVTLEDFNNGINYVDIMYRNQKALERGM